jgi:hypothetical protein
VEGFENREERFGEEEVRKLKRWKSEEKGKKSYL